jgi:hypothetical protein
VRELAHEADGVGDRRGSAARQLDAPRGRVERREQLVGDEDVGVRQRAHQCRLAGVRVSRDRDLRDAAPLAASPFDVARARQILDVLAELRDAPADVLAVDLELGLAGAARPDAAAEPGHRLAPASQAGQQVVELRELDLGLALSRPRVQREDVEDQRGPVDHLRAEPILQVAQLPRRQLVVEDHDLRPARMHGAVDLLELALADERGGVRIAPRLDEPRDGVRAGRVGERGQLVEVRLLDAAADADQDGHLAHARRPRRRQRRLEHRRPMLAAPASVLAHRSVTPPALECSRKRVADPLHRLGEPVVGHRQREPHVPLAVGAVPVARRHEHAGAVEQQVRELG